MTKTFHEANEEEHQKEKEQRTPPGGEYGTVTSGNIDGERLAEMYERVETFLKTTGPAEPREETPRDTIQNPGIDIDLDNLDQSGLLTIIARVNLAQLSVLFRMADYVRPAGFVSVSGVEVIDNPDEAQLVVPNSDTGNITTKRLIIRAEKENNESIYIGDDNVKPQSGTILDAGEVLDVQYNLASAPLYMASPETGQAVQILGVS